MWGEYNLYNLLFIQDTDLEYPIHLLAQNCFDNIQRTIKLRAHLVIETHPSFFWLHMKEKCIYTVTFSGKVDFLIIKTR